MTEERVRSPWQRKGKGYLQEKVAIPTEGVAYIFNRELCPLLRLYSRSLRAACSSREVFYHSISYLIIACKDSEICFEDGMCIISAVILCGISLKNLREFTLFLDNRIA